ncbi:hypothetical protein Rhopal_001285-T1 [Rhodotorula paludigena]|uniref:PH domain-containing protein n=1 Tax=Rhodotorula paludigena TaxID=86838 RepID=A0AAV5GFA0_9BASI|nr:hypothetical protein Rhopal_001285-T1 [Rhodotorula paludigena]
MLRLASYGAAATTAHGHPKSPQKPALAPPTEAFPPPPAHKPSDVLLNRAHEVKRIAKGTAAFFQGVAEAHNSHALVLRKLSNPSSTPIPTPFAEAALFLPLPPDSPPDPAAPTDSAKSLGGTGTEGWAQILADAKETNARTADAHAALAKSITKDVVGPLARVRIDLKASITQMEREVAKAIDAVQRERDTAAPLLSRLSTSLTQSSLPLSAPSLHPPDDPVLLRAQVEAQLRVQVLRENDLLAVVKGWTEKMETRERDVFAEIKRCWAAWEQANSAMLLGNQQLSMFLSATVDSVPPEAEWAHFVKLNHVLASSVPEKTLDDVVWDGKGDPLTSVVLEGLLERQTSFLKSWKPAYFILTPSGHLHIYGPPPASALPPAAGSTESGDSASSSLPSTPEDRASLSSTPAYPPLSAPAQHLLLHSSPHLSLNLALCTLGPMPTPAPAAENGKKKPSPLDAVFTLVESVGKGGKGEGSGTKHVLRCKGEKGWEEMGTWVAAIGKFCATPTAPPPPSPPTPTPSTFAAASAHDGTADARPLPAGFAPPGHSPDPSSSSSSLPTAPREPATDRRPPPPLPPPSFAPALPARGLGVVGESPALPSLPTSPLSDASSSTAPPPPPLPPRDSVHSFSSFEDGDGDTTRNSVLVIEDDDAEGDAYLSRAMSGLGVAGAGLARREEDDGSDESDGGDLGRSLSSGSLSRKAQQQQQQQQGSVRSLAAAWEKNASSGPAAPPRDEQGKSPVGPDEDDEDDDAEGRDKDEGDEEEQKRDGADEGAQVAPAPKGKKGKKKRKSKGGAAAAAANKPTERPLPLPSVDPEHADLGLPSPHSPSFNPTPASLHSPSSERAQDDDPRTDGDLAGMASPPPMVLEEVEEAPSPRAGEDDEDKRKDEEKEKEDEAQPGEAK